MSELAEWFRALPPPPIAESYADRQARFADAAWSAVTAVDLPDRWRAPLQRLSEALSSDAAIYCGCEVRPCWAVPPLRLFTEVTCLACFRNRDPLEDLGDDLVCSGCGSPDISPRLEAWPLPGVEVVAFAVYCRPCAFPAVLVRDR